MRLGRCAGGRELKVVARDVTTVGLRRPALLKLAFKITRIKKEEEEAMEEAHFDVVRLTWAEAGAV